MDKSCNANSRIEEMYRDKVVIIIPVYKTEKYLRESVRSVLEQNYENINIILVDDGSPDNCPQICDQFALKNENVKVIHKENGGLSSARNVGLDAVPDDTSYVLFLDSDDCLINGAIEGLVRKAQETQAEMVIPDRYTKVYEMSGKRSIALHFTASMYCSDPRKFAMDVLMEQGRGWRAHALLYSFPAIEKIKARFPVGRISEDIIFNLQMLSGVGKIVFYPYSTVQYLKREGSITTTYQSGFDQDVWYIDTQALAFLEKTGWNNSIGREKADALLCRNIIVYLAFIMSKKNKMPYAKKVRKAKEFITHSNARDVIRKKHRIPYFESKKTQFGIGLVYFLLRYRQDKLVFKILSML